MGLLLLVVGIGLFGFVVERTLMVWLRSLLNRAHRTGQPPSPRVQRFAEATARIMAPRSQLATGVAALPLLCGQPDRSSGVAPTGRSTADQTRMLPVGGTLPPPAARRANPR